MKGIRFGLYFLLISVGLLITSFFMEWISGYTLYHMYSLFRFTPTFILYLFPFFALVILILGMVLLFPTQIQKYKLSFLLFFLDLNLNFIFIFQMIQIHGKVLWRHPGIYIGIISTAFFLFGFVVLLNNSLIRNNNNE